MEMLLGKVAHVPLLTCEGKTWSQHDFVNEILAAREAITSCSGLDRHNFILLDSKHPVYLYAYMLALVEAGYRILIPNRDYFAGIGEPIMFASQVARPSAEGLAVCENKNFVPIDVPSGNIIVFSSGSTGKPKGIVHLFDNFIKNAMSVSSVVKGRKYVNLTWLSPYLVSAISHFLVHWLHDSHLIFDDFQNLPQLAEIAQKFPGLGVVGSPVHVTNGVDRLPEGHEPSMFFSSGDSVSRHAIEKIVSKFPTTTFYYVYGLAELAGRFFINTLTAQASLPPDCLGLPIGGCTPIIEDGAMFVKSDFLFNGYIIENKFLPVAVAHDTGDMALVDGELVRLLGRSNDEVKVLGNKINLKHVETRVKNVLATDDLVLVPSRNEKFGNLIALVIKGKAQSRIELMKTLRTTLGPHEIPHLYYSIDEFPFTQTMKVDRKLIAANLNQYERM